MTSTPSAALNPQTNPPDIGGLSIIIKNIIFIIMAGVSFALWLSSTITTPRRIDRLEETAAALNQKQNIIETQTSLIYSDLQEIKAVLLRRNK
ncbi:MAG: hypothetical protein LBM71_05695 [Elusimicrobiota bacterium]|jgi:sensor c-di-GMP phosphodiesterase-like protein|nr:hypothetical protein [Elusimicrobiota bacterium]